ncbi:MAG TPA: FHA domain-containing protein [Gemmataceae bacterium]|nr:FHA domain-containing protein [Gemmataceae bacterium]
MADPRLNSVHLEPRRREEYRRAREALLNARGWQTVAAECLPETGRRPVESPTLIPNNQQPPASDVRFWLQDRDFIYPLKVGLNTIGRAPDNDVVLEGSYISRRHCVILVHASEVCELYDTASKNGTYLNGQRITGPTRLTPGDEIRVCDYQLRFLSRADVPPPPAKTMTQND